MWKRLLLGKKMGGLLQRAMEFLGPLVDTKAWDYCVVWKLGDDPFRFIEWMGCCCSGGGDGGVNVKEEIGEVEVCSRIPCRDDCFRHFRRSKACEALAQLPTSISLYTGIHGDVVISNQPKWLYNESAGTRVLVPVSGGLIELFATKHIPQDGKIIDLITAHCNISSNEEETMTEQSYTDLSFNNHSLDSSPDVHFQDYPNSLPFSTSIPKLQNLPQLTQSNNPFLGFDGSSTTTSSSSKPSHEHPSLPFYSDFLSQYKSLMPPIQKPSCCKKLKNGMVFSKQQQRNSVTECAANKVHMPAKNIISERNRRKRINDNLFTLRALVPKISKINRAAIVIDAIDYIHELQTEMKHLRDELQHMEEEEEEEEEDGLKVKISPSQHSQHDSVHGEKIPMEAQVEVNQINESGFLIKLFCKQKQCGFTRLMEAIGDLDLQVVDANITTFDGKVLNILKVEAKKNDIQVAKKNDVLPKKLRDSLMKFTGC